MMIITYAAIGFANTRSLIADKNSSELNYLVGSTLVWEND